MATEMTPEEKKTHNRIAHSVLRVRWPKDCEYAFNEDGTPADLTNHELIVRGVGGKTAGVDYTEQQFYDFVMDLRAQGLLVKKGLAPEPVDPATTLPHEDIPELKNIRNLADVIRVKNLPKEKLMRFANLKQGSPSFEEFNERIQYIYDHRIGDGELPTIVDKAEQSSSADGSYREARAIVDAVTNKDVGSVGSGPGQGGWDKANRFKTRVGQIIDQQEKKGTSGPAVLKWVKTELADLQSSSAR